MVLLVRIIIIVTVTKKSYSVYIILMSKSGFEDEVLIKLIVGVGEKLFSFAHHLTSFLCRLFFNF
jgi:hypothetical protein